MLEMIDPDDVLDWSVDFGGPVLAFAWTAVEDGGVTPAAASEDLEAGRATAKVSGNGAPLGSTWQLRCRATLSGGRFDYRTMTYRVGPKVVT